MVVGILSLELHLPMVSSLKEKRSILKSLKDQLRNRFNIAVAEVDANDKWQLASIGVAAIGSDRQHIDASLQHVADWVRESRLVDLIRVEMELL